MTRSPKASRRLKRLLEAVPLIVIAWFVAWRVSVSHVANAELAAIRAAGLPCSGAELNAYYTAVPDHENAALVMTQAFALMRDFPDNRAHQVAVFQVPPREQSLTVEQMSLLAQYAELNAAALRKMRAAVKLSKCRYPVDLSEGYGSQVGHIYMLKKLAQIAELLAVLATDWGSQSLAHSSIANILGMARTLDAEPVVISQLVRVALIKMAASALERSLNASQWNDSDLADLSPAFLEAEATNSMERALIGERAIDIPYFRTQLTATDPTKTPDADETGAPISPSVVQWANEIKHNSNSFRYLRALGFLERDLCFYLAAMETNITLVRLPPPRPTAAANNFANAKEFTRRHYYTLSSMFLPSLSRAILHQTESLAVIRLSAAALAVERFRLARKRLPETLRELVPQFLSAVPIDPFDGQPLRYHPTAKRYLIYSVGAGVRDGGVREGPATPKPADQPPGTVTFTVAR